MRPNTQIIRPESIPAARSGPAKGVFEFSLPLSIQRDVKAVITIHADKLRKRDLLFLQEKVADLVKGFEDEEPEGNDVRILSACS